MESFDHAGNRNPYSEDENCFNLNGDEEGFKKILCKIFL